MRITAGDLDDPRILALLDTHLARARETSPPCSVHALDHAGLKAPTIRFFAMWSEADELLGVGALNRFAADHAEIKSMHVAETARRRGAGAAMVRHLIALARADGMARLSLETGSQDYFAPARALYTGHGFAVCGPFAHYREDPNSVYMTMVL